LRLTVNPGGSQLAALDAEGRVTVWRTEDGAVAWIAEPEEAAAAPESPAAADAPRGAVAFSADGQKLLIAHSTRLRFRDSADGRLLQQFDQPAPVAAAALAPDSVHFVVGRTGAEGNAAIERFTLERVIAAHEGAVGSLAVSPDGAALLTGGADKTIRVWSWEDGAALRQYAGSEGAVASVAFTRDGARVVAGGEDGMVRVWPAAPPEGADPAAPLAAEMVFQNSAPVRGVAVSFDNTRLGACGEDGVVRLWELAGGRELERFPGHEGEVYSLAFSPDGATVVSGGADSARAWSISALRVIAAEEERVEDLVLMAGGAHAVTAGAAVRRWSLGDGQLIREFAGSEAPLRALAVRADDQQLAAAGRDAKLYLWNAGDGTLSTQFKTPAPMRSLAYSPDNLKLIAACEDDHIRFFNPAGGEQIQEIVSGTALHQAIFTRDGRRVISVGDEGAARLWAFVSPEAVRTLAGHGGPVYGAAVSPDGRLIVSASGDQTLRIWDAATGAQLKQMTGHQGPVYSAAFSADGALVVSCGADKSIRLWDVLGGRQLKQIPASDASLYSVAFHPDGRRVAAAGLDKKIRLYDVITGELQATLSDHNDYVNRVAYNARGDRLLSVGYGGNLVVRDAAGKPLYQARLGRVSNFADLSPDGARLVVSVGNGDVFSLETPSSTR
jgi:WD40 repeat protein